MFYFLILVAPPKFKLVGCFKDTAVRALSGRYFVSVMQSIELCVTACGGMVSVTVV